MYHATTPTAAVAPRASPHVSRASRRSKTTTRHTTTLSSARFVALSHAATRDDAVTASGPLLSARHEKRSRSLVLVRAKKGFFDEMLDVMEGGPKLRKWYGQDSSVGAPGAERPDPPPGGGDAKRGADDTPEPSRQEVLKAWDKQPRRATLVTDVDTALGEAIVVQLIVAKQPVVATGLPADVCASRFGPYVTAADAADLKDESETAYLLRKGVRAVICCGEPGALPAAAAKDGKVKHVVVVGSCGKAGVFDAVFGGEDGKRKDPKRAEAFVKAFEACGGAEVPALTVVRPGTVRPGLGGKAVAFSQGGGGDGGAINLEDAAECVVRCLGAPPKKGVLTFDAVETSGQRRSWKALFGELAA